MDDEVKEEMKSAIKQLFRKIDTYGINKVRSHTLQSTLQENDIFVTKEEVEKFIADCDLDDDKCMSYSEFEKMMIKIFIDIEKEREAMMGAFKMFDKNGDGVITKKELIQVLKRDGKNKFAEDEAIELMAEADFDGDGIINFDELVTVLCGHPLYEWNKNKSQKAKK